MDRVCVCACASSTSHLLRTLWSSLIVDHTYSNSVFLCNHRLLLPINRHLSLSLFAVGGHVSHWAATTEVPLLIGLSSQQQCIQQLYLSSSPLVDQHWLIVLLQIDFALCLSSLQLFTLCVWPHCCGHTHTLDCTNCSHGKRGFYRLCLPKVSVFRCVHTHTATLYPFTELSGSALSLNAVQPVVQCVVRSVCCRTKHSPPPQQRCHTGFPPLLNCFICFAFSTLPQSVWFTWSSHPVLFGIILKPVLLCLATLTTTTRCATATTAFIYLSGNNRVPLCC